MMVLNYHHLLAFWAVAREGGLLAAGRLLHVSHSTLSAQIHAFEARLRERLFEKVGRRLHLTDRGRVVFRYADEIFALGRELVDAVRGAPTGRALRLDVGVANSVPKLLVKRILDPALALGTPVRLHCREDALDRLLGDLALHAVDIVIADAPVPTGSKVRAFNHVLGQSSVSVFGTRGLVAPRRRGFPDSLDGAPLLLPLENLPLRRELDHWFQKKRITPVIVAELEDSALVKAFGAEGVGLFAGPTVIAHEIESQFGVERLGELDGIVERTYAISAERRVKHPGVVAITEAARRDLFS